MRTKQQYIEGLLLVKQKRLDRIRFIKRGEKR